MRFIAIILTIILSSCNALDRPQVINSQSNDSDEVVSLPGGGALIFQRLRQQEENTTCWVRARNFRGFVPIPCNIAETARP